MYSCTEDVKKVFDIIKEKEIEFIDFRFTDFKGTWHHVSYNVKSIDEDSFKGIPFDGSSIPYWQPINRSDMQLIPDAKTAFIDPFTADATLVIICDAYDIYNKRPYAKCPRSIAKKALEYLKSTGLGDTAYFGPENEFFVFDSRLRRAWVDA